MTVTYQLPGPVLYTGGTFDLFHAGHVNFLKMCKDIVGENGSVVVSLNTDEFVLRTKHVTTLPYPDRYAVVSTCKYVDLVIENTFGEDSKPTILSVSPRFIAIGTDWATQDYYKQMGFTPDWLNNHGITLIYLPYYEGISSSKIRRMLHDS